MKLWKVYKDDEGIYYVAPYDFKQYVKWYGFEFDDMYLSRTMAEKIAAKRNKREELNNGNNS